jgi:transcriptional repressor NrdR
MRCPRCSGKTHVYDSRPVGDTTVRRRRECLRCELRFTTREKMAVELAPPGAKVPA